MAEGVDDEEQETDQNGPLNLTVNSTSLSTTSPPTAAPGQLPGGMPQLILAAGQLVNGVQGAQVLIPTSQGISTQTILTIPLSHINNGEQLHHFVNSSLLPQLLPSLPLKNSLLPNLDLAQSLNLTQQPTPPVNLNPLLNRLNGEITVTMDSSHTSQGQPQGQSTPAPAAATTSSRPPTPDLLVDSPTQPTINSTTSTMVDGIDLEEIKEFAKAFKLRRLSLGLTQTQVGQALSVTEGPAYSQSAICSSNAVSQLFSSPPPPPPPPPTHPPPTHPPPPPPPFQPFEKLDITPKSAQKIKPVLERWMKEAEERYKSGQTHLTDFIGVEPSKKRKRRTSFTPQALELLNAHFERNTHPSGTEITTLAQQLGYEREVIRIWFCNKRQALKNTVRMMSKGIV